MKGLGLWALAAMAIPAIAATPWNVARSGHFEVWSNAPADTARTLAAGMERLRAFFISQLGIVPHDVVRVICFATGQEYLDYRIRPGADGFSLIGPDGQFIVLHSTGRVDLRIPAHEYAHLLIHSSGWKLPEWLAEGISEVVSSVQFGERYSFIGGDLPGRSPELKTKPWMPPAELFAISLKGEPDAAREPLFYSQSWALAEMLIVSPAYAPRFPAFLAMLAKGSTSQAAIEGVYRVPAEALFREARERVLRGLTPIPLPAVGPGPAVREEAASWFDARVTLARLHHAASQTDLAEAALRELAAERPDAPEVPATLGLIALDRKDPDTAVREWGRARRARPSRRRSVLSLRDTRRRSWTRCRRRSAPPWNAPSRSARISTRPSSGSAGWRKTPDTPRKPSPTTAPCGRPRLTAPGSTTPRSPACCWISTTARKPRKRPCRRGVSRPRTRSAAAHSSSPTWPIPSSL